jgi:predicted RNA binding protein YcfA (HicA-like mRNA interferase family)
MPPLAPIKRRNLIEYLRKMGFEGPYAGGRHQFMVRDERKLVLPNPHRGDVGRVLLQEILRQAGINRDEWEKLK